MSKGPHHYSPYDVPMWESIAARAMKLQKCASCGQLRYPPGPACPNCLGTDSTWVPISGAGHVLSWTTFHRQYLPAYPPPSTVLAVKLAEGPIMVANIDAAEVSRLAVDLPVTITYADHPDGYKIPTFSIVG